MCRKQTPITGVSLTILQRNIDFQTPLEYVGKSDDIQVVNVRLFLIYEPSIQIKFHMVPLKCNVALACARKMQIL